MIDGTYLEGDLALEGTGEDWKLDVELAHGKLLTNENKARRSLSSEAHCHLCPTFVESIVHVLRDCPTSKEELETVYTITTPT